MLSFTLNEYVKREASKLRYEIKDIAPSSIDEVIRNYHERGIVTVWSGASDATIFGDASVNYAFRAWHDLTHILTGNNFTLQGETITALHQIATLPQGIARIVLIEVIGQASHYFQHGHFPSNQIHFTMDALKRGDYV